MCLTTVEAHLEAIRCSVDASYAEQYRELHPELSWDIIKDYDAQQKSDRDSL